MPLIYALSEEQRAAKCEVVSRCSIGKTHEVYEKLNDTHKEMLEQSCFGHLIHLKDMQANMIIHQLLMRLASPWNVDANVFWFQVGGKKIRFSVEEFALVSGLLVGDGSNVDKSVGKECRLVNKYFKKSSKVYRKDVWEKFNRIKDANDRYKLGLIVILTYVVWGSEERRAVGWWIFKLVEDLDAFNKYPWGNASYEATVYAWRRDMRESFKYPPIGYTLYGFPHALKVWALEAIPSLRKFAEIVDENALPRLMKWGAVKRVSSSVIQLLLQSREVEAFRKLVPSEAEKEMAYFLMPREDEVEDDETDNAPEQSSTGNVEYAPEQSTGNVDYKKLKELVEMAVSEEKKRMSEELVKVVEENKRLFALVDTLQRKVELMEVRLCCEENEVGDEPNAPVEETRNAEEEEQADIRDEQADIRDEGEGNPNGEGNSGVEEMEEKADEIINEGMEGGMEEEQAEIREEEEGGIEEEQAEIKVKEPAANKSDVLEEEVAEKLNEEEQVDIRQEGEGNPNGEGNAVGEERAEVILNEDDLEKEGREKVVKVVRFNLPTKPEKRKAFGSPYIKEVPKKRKVNKSDFYNPFRRMDVVLMKSVDKFIDSCEDSVQVSLVDCDIDARILKDVVRGASLPSNVMDSALCEIRRRCLVDPNIFDPNARVMDTVFASYVKGFHARHMRKKSGGGINTVCKGRFDRLFLNIVKGAAPEFSKSWEGCTTLYVPMIEREHWFLVKIDLSGRTIYVYDSLPGHVRKVLLASCVTPMQVVIPLLLNKHVKGYENYSLRKLAVKSVGCPSQDNGSDCGIFVLKFVEFMLGGVDLSLIRSGHVPDWRKKLVAGLLSWNLQT